MILILLVFGYLAIGSLLTFASVLWENYAPAKWSCVFEEETFTEHCVKVLLCWPVFLFLLIIFLIGLSIYIFVKEVFVKFDRFIKDNKK